jgi:predicted Zn finger-like uncharacterized protein
LIVTCHVCDTSFQLDESRVPLQGIRVRCSRCKEAFFLEHPSASGAEAIHDVAEQAAEAEAVPPPDSTQDLPPSNVVDDIGGDIGGGDIGEGIGDAADIAIDNEIDDEADWEFNHDPAPEQTAAPVVEEEPSAEPAPSGGSGLELAGDPEPEPEVAAPVMAADDAGSISAESDAGDESAFGSVDDFSSLMEEDPDQQLDESIALEDDSSLLDGIDVSEPEAGGHSSGSAQGDELGEPENWDFFSDESLEGGGAAAPAPAAAGETIGRVALQLAGSLSDDAFGFSDADDEYEEGAAVPSKAMEIARVAGQVVGWAVTLGLFAIGLLSGLWPTAQAMVESPQLIELPDVRAESVRGSFVPTARAGTLFEVTGVLRNRSRKPVALEDAFQIALLTADGSRLDASPAPAGTVLSDRQLRELPKDELWSVQSAAAYELSRTHLGAGAEMPFQALFAEVPAEATRFAMEQAPGSLSEPAPVEGLPQADLLDGASEPETGVPEASAPPGAAGADTPADDPTDLGDELTWGE